MPTTEPNKPFHWRNNSGELDVFAATQYFSAAAEDPRHNNSSTFSPKIIAENKLHVQSASRMSLDVPTTKNIPTVQKLQLKETNKCKQPNSPGGRLASFLNSLFNQTDSKKKLKLKDRRSSISHFRSNSNESKSSTSSGVVTPPADAKTPTKSVYVDLRGVSDHQPAINELRCFRNSTAINRIADEEDRGFRRFSDVDDGADTDSSSDLFDLPNYDLDLPVYGTTEMDRIRIEPPISRV